MNEALFGAVVGGGQGRIDRHSQAENTVTTYPLWPDV